MLRHFLISDGYTNFPSAINEHLLFCFLPCSVPLSLSLSSIAVSIRATQFPADKALIGAPAKNNGRIPKDNLHTLKVVDQYFLVANHYNCYLKGNKQSWESEVMKQCDEASSLQFLCRR
jgi:hypothetical protein